MSRKMKDSGVEWIGEIPKEWKISKVKYFVKCLDGKRIPIDVGERKSGPYPYWGAGSITDYVENYIFDEELILLGEDGAPFFDYTRPVAFLVNEKIWVNNHIHVLKPSKSISSLFLTFFLNAVDYKTYINGSILNKLTQNNMKNITIVLPTFEEQYKIARFLNEKCEKIDSIIKKSLALKDEYRLMKQSIITRSVTRGIVSERLMRDSGIAWLGKIPEDWKVYRIANLYQERSENGLEELPILTVSINSGVSDREIADEEKDRVFVRSEDRTKYKRVYPGDLVYNMMRAWQGAFGAVRVEGMVSPAYVVAKPKDGIEVDSRYMEALLRTQEATEEMHRYSRGIVDFRLRLYWPEFKNIRICLPPIEEQKEIADFIDRKSQEIDLLINKKEQFISELENYKKSLIYEYVTGKKEVPES